MAALDLTPYYQPTGTTSDGTKFDNALAAIQSTINALDNGNIAVGANIALSKLAITGTPTGTKFLRDDGSWQVPSGATGPAIYRGTTADGTFTLIDIVNTTTESDLLGVQGSGFTIPANTLGTSNTTKKLRIKIEGDIKPNGTVNITFRVYLGGTKFIDTGTVSVAGGGAPTLGSFCSEVTIPELGATNSQNIQQRVTFAGVQGSPTTGLGGAASFDGLYASNGVGTIDMTAGQAVRATAQWAAASPNSELRVRSVVMEVI